MVESGIKEDLFNFALMLAEHCRDSVSANESKFCIDQGLLSWRKQSVNLKIGLALSVARADALHGCSHPAPLIMLDLNAKGNPYVLYLKIDENKHGMLSPHNQLFRSSQSPPHRMSQD